MCTDLLGYAEVCIQCSLSVALERNSKRPIPIPHSTIESMERRIELPEPAQHHWEKRSMVVRNDCEDERFIYITVWVDYVYLVIMAYWIATKLIWHGIKLGILAAFNIAYTYYNHGDPIPNIQTKIQTQPIIISCKPHQ